MGAGDNREIVLAYVAAAQRARSSGLDEDFAEVRSFFAEDVVVSLASPWTDDPFTVAHRGADAVIARLRESVNSGSRLKTENRAVLADGDHVFVEQISTATTDDGVRRSAVGFLFTLKDGRITSVKTFRNNANVPT